MKNKNLIAYLVFGALIVIAGVILFLVMNKKPATAPVVQAPVEDVVLTMKPEDIGLSLTAAAGNKKLILEVANTKGITKLDYELSYVKKGDIPIGVMGQQDIESGQVFRQEIVLGTCSDVCHYDENVSDIKLILKVAKADGTTSQVEKSLELTE